MNILTTRLVDRILRARGKSRLQRLLKEAKDKAGSKAKFKTAGKPEEIHTAVNEAVNGNFLLQEELTSLADELEEVGGQHIYLYKLTKKGREALTVESLKAAFKALTVSADYYVEQPPGADVHWIERDGHVFLKQVHTAEYWELDREKSVWNDDVRRRFWEKIRRRGVNLMLIDFKKGTVEICIDRLRGENDEKLAERELTAFLDSLKSWLDAAEHLAPVKIATAFSRIVTETLDETFMNSDGAYDQSIAHRISNRRRGTKGTDVRKNKDWNLDGEDYVREGLGIYWFTASAPITQATGAAASDDNEYEADEDEEDEDTKEAGSRPAVYTIISSVTRMVNKVKQEHSKIYISAKIAAKDRAHVVGRIRHFAG